MRSSWIHRRDRRGVWFVAPFLLGFLLFMMVPLGYAVYTSLYTYRIIGGTIFTGAANYTQTLQNGQFWHGVIRVIVFAAIQIPVMLASRSSSPPSSTWASRSTARPSAPSSSYRSRSRRRRRGDVDVPARAAVGPFTRLAGALGFRGTNFFVRSCCSRRSS